MAAVAAEPGAATASTTTTGDGGELELVPAVPGAKLDSSATQDYAPVMDLVPQRKDGDAVQECSQVQMELVSRPDLEAAGKALAASSEDEHIQTSCLGVGVENTENHALEGCGSKHTTMSRAERLRQFFSPNVEPANEVSKHEPYACLQNSSISDTQPSVVFLHSFPAHPVPTEAGLSIAEPAEPMIDYCQNPELTQPTNVESDYRALIKTTHEAELESEPADDVPPGSEYKEELSEDASLERSEYTEQVDSIPVLERETVLGTPMETGYICGFSSITDQNSPSPELPVMSLDQVPSAELGDSRSPQRRLEIKFNKSDQVSKPPPPLAGGETEEVQSESVGNLIPGSEVRVSLDHIIDDALVVSFRLGEKIFSGVLMDLSKRFGPYGIPITVFPKREYKDKPESMQLMAEPLQQDPEKVEQPVQENPDCPVVTAGEPNADPQPEINQWTSKPPPLFQEGAPYPPPLFIRDTYNQSLPQPPPRKIKRPKRRLYREEPTSIMNAIKLRPRQVLCDKCKGAVTTIDKREPRRGPLSDSRGDDARRRRNDGSAPVSKRPRNEPRSEEKGRGSAEASKRQASGIRQVSSSSLAGQVKGGAGGNRVLRASSAATASSSSSPSNSNPRVQLGAKKVLQSKNVDHSKAREVLKMAKAQKRQRETTVVSGNAKTMTRAAALQEAHAHQKVHFTRRLQQISGVGPSNTAPLPPRMRIKPQRYRNEDNDSSTCKPPWLEKVPGSGHLSPPKPGAPRCNSMRSSSSSSCSTGEAATAETQGPDNGPEPELSPQTQSQPQVEPPTATEHNDPKAEPEEQGGQEERRETRGSKAGNLVVYMTLDPSQPDSSNTSMCSVDSADDLKSSNSECSSTETFDFPPPGDLHSPPTAPGTSSAVAEPSPAPTEEKKPRKSQKVFSKNVSKCVSLDGRTICVGDIVWAKIYGFPWWPARVLGIQISRKDNGLLVRQEARVAWFGSPTTSFLALAQVAPFLESFQSRFDKKRKGLYRKAITEAAKAAKQLTPEVRALLTQFET